jgi:hypothetical protein
MVDGWNRIIKPRAGCKDAQVFRSLEQELNKKEENPKAREISQSSLIDDRFSPIEKNYDFAVA